MASGQYEKKKKKKKKKTTPIDKIWAGWKEEVVEEGKEPTQSMKKIIGVKQDDKDDSVGIGDEEGVRSAEHPLSPKERLSGKGRIRRYIRRRVR